MKESFIPLAHRLRPKKTEDFVGQEKAMTIVREFIHGQRRSLMLWGPPGSGKTSIAGIISAAFPDTYYALSAVANGIKEIRGLAAHATDLSMPPIAFIDEIHRFTRVQQDALLPYVESGAIILIGATTENPSFSITSPLLSRLQIVRLEPLENKEIQTILYHALEQDDAIVRLERKVSDEGIQAIAGAARGDARAALNMLEYAIMNTKKDIISLCDLEKTLDRPLYHDRSGEMHYNLISAFQKAIRAGDVDASVYWLGRMMEAGEDRIYIIRRMARIASEDIGMAEPHALGVVTNAHEAFRLLGSPEGDLCLYQAAVYLACAPKSNALYLSEKKTKALIKKTGTPGVPMNLRNASTRLMKAFGYGKGYIYAHDDPSGALDMGYMPEGILGVSLYTPGDSGFEKRIRGIMDARREAKKRRTVSYRKTDKE